MEPLSIADPDAHTKDVEGFNLIVNEDKGLLWLLENDNSDAMVISC